MMKKVKPVYRYVLQRPEMVRLTEQNMFESRKKKKKSLTGFGQPQTSSHPIYIL